MYIAVQLGALLAYGRIESLTHSILHGHFWPPKYAFQLIIYCVFQILLGVALIALIVLYVEQEVNFTRQSSKNPKIKLKVLKK